MSAAVPVLPAPSVAVTKRWVPSETVGASGHVYVPVKGAAVVVQMIGSKIEMARTSTTESGSATPSTTVPSEVPVGDPGGVVSITTAVEPLWF